MQTDFLSIRSVSVANGDAKVVATVIFNNRLITYCRKNIIEMVVCSLSVMLGREDTTFAWNFCDFLHDQLDKRGGKMRSVDFMEML